MAHYQHHIVPDAIEPAVPPAVQQALLEKCLGTRIADRAAIEAAHRELLSASPGLHRRLLRWLAANETDSPHLGVGLAILATGADLDARRFVADLVQGLPVRTVADTVDYVHGWYVDRAQLKRVRRRYQDEMTRAYAATADVVREELQRSSAITPNDFRGGEVLVTLGQYDRVQQVLDHLQLPYQTLPCQVVDGLPLRADQVLIVNCPGSFTAAGLETVRRFVAAGGTLITTDWALQTTLQQAFPGIVEYTGRPTRDDVVRVSWINPESPYTCGVEVPGQALSWWLESQSYPIRIRDPRVTVLVRSAEMGQRYQEDALVITFDYGEGTVFHLTSHYYLQRSQGNRATGAAAAVESDLGKAILAKAATGDLSGGQLSAAYSSMRLLANILYESRRRCGV
jgi:hypothetical protein